VTPLQEAQALKKTPLYDRHVALEAKIVNFGGWAMPIYYSGIIAEHHWVRQYCGVFDVSHMGEIRVEGPGAFKFLQYRLTNDLNKVADGRMLYSLLCDEMGRTLDDILIYRATADSYYLIVNAASIDRDLEALVKYAPADVEIKNFSDDMACLAVQGPAAESVLEKLFGWELKSLDYYAFKEVVFQSSPVWISRSGYTGEDGFEIFTSNALSVAVWDQLMDAGEKAGVKPIGLGARNTLRLEAGNALFGNDLDTTTTPLEAGLGWTVSFTKGGFVGRDMLIKQKESGVSRRLVGFRVLDKPIAREHYSIYHDDRKIGMVTSGSYGPTVGGNIGLGYVQKGHEAPGTPIAIEIHGRRVPAEVVKLPFVTPKHKNKGLR